MKEGKNYENKIKILVKHTELYYDKNSPKMSDEEKEDKNLENKNDEDK